MAGGPLRKLCSVVLCVKYNLSSIRFMLMLESIIARQRVVAIMKKENAFMTEYSNFL